MLVLSRRIGERIIINDNTEVVVLGFRSGNVRLGITAPAEVPVHRAEVQEALAREGEPTPVGFRKDAAT